jgi:hypothetical protein
MEKEQDKAQAGKPPGIHSTRFSIKLADQQELSFEQIRQMVQAAIDKLFPPDANKLNYTWIRDLFPGYAIFDHEGKLLRVDYQIEGEAAMLGTPIPVDVEYVQASAQRPGNAGTRHLAPGTLSFISQLSAIEDAGLARIPILVTGSWVKGGREVSFTKADLDAAIENFNKLANSDLNVDYDHACEDLERAAGRPTPSAGRIVALDPPEEFRDPGNGIRDTGKGESLTPNSESRVPSPESRWILYGRYEPTERARQMIKNREYRYVSAAFAKDYPDRRTGESQGLTLTSVALTNQPFLDELPEIWLSVAGVRDSGLGTREDPKPAAQVPNPEVRNPKSENSTRLSAEKRGKDMKLTLKRSAEGKHEAFDPDNSKVGEIDHDHLCTYAKNHLADDLKLSAAPTRTEKLSDLAAADRLALENEFTTNLFARIGVAGKSVDEVLGLLKYALDPPAAEITVLSGAIGNDGKLNAAQLNSLNDSGKISRSAWRRAQEAQARVDKALAAGQLTPAMIQTGHPLRCALMSTTNDDMFLALVERRPSIVNLNRVAGIGGSGSETGESPRELFSRLVDEKKQQLMQADNRLNELDAHRKAGALVAKENPDLLKNYRADAKSA